MHSGKERASSARAFPLARLRRVFVPRRSELALRLTAAAVCMACSAHAAPQTFHVNLAAQQQDKLRHGEVLDLTDD